MARSYISSSRRAFLFATASTISGAGLAAQPLHWRDLFVVARSTNENVLHYALRMKSDGEIARDEPLTAYWIMHAEDGHREGLTWLERRFAYGWDVVSKVTHAGFDLRLKAFPSRTVRVRRRGSGSYAPWLRIAGKRALLERIFVQVDEGGLTPSVSYLDVIGTLPRGGERVSERIEG